MAVQKIRLTEKLITKLQAEPAGRYEVRDDISPLRLRVTPSGHKSYSVLLHHSGNGKPQRITLGDASQVSVADARARALEASAAVSNGRDLAAERRHAREVVDHQGMTLGEALDVYLRDKRIDGHRKLADATHLNYTTSLATTFGMSVKLSALTPARVHTAYLARCDGKFTPGADQGLRCKASPEKARMAVRALRALLRFHGMKPQADAIAELLRLKVGTISASHARPSRIDASAAPSLMAWLMAQYKASPVGTIVRANHAAMLFALCTGLRHRTLSLLTWNMVDFSSATLTVPAEAMKARRPEVLPIPPRMLAMLEQRKTETDDALIFARTGKRQATLMGVAYLARLPWQVSPHDLRKAYAMALDATECPDTGIKLLLCHSTRADVTLHHYRARQATDYAADAGRAETWLFAQVGNTTAVKRLRALAGQRSEKARAAGRAYAARTTARNTKKAA